MKTTKIKLAVFCVSMSVVSMLAPSCSNMTHTQKGAVIGTAAGGTVGAIIGKKAGNTAVGAVIGGAIGGTAGAIIGHKMDKQAEEIQKTIPDAEVIREGEGLIVKFESGILFDVDKTDLKDNARTNLEKLAASLKSNPETDILIVGHTDATGSDAYNLGLSERRATAVKSYVMANGVSGSRLSTVGKGEAEPIADNDTETGRAQNRRVEIVIVANQQMKEEAKASAN
jgi:outer membrane protein OmpA-like peptidoglycan-associated protein